jgi:dihydroneopterin aldolase
MSHLQLNGLRVRARVGCQDSERAYPQMLKMDLRIHYDMRKAIASDSITDSVDYRQVAACIRELLGSREWKLIETLANDIGQAVRRQSDAITGVEVTLFKDVIVDAESVVVVLDV